MPTISFRVSREMVEEIKHMADKANMAISEFIRNVVMQGFGNVEEADISWKRFFWNRGVPETKLRYAYNGSKRIDEFLMVVSSWAKDVSFIIEAESIIVIDSGDRTVVPFSGSRPVKDLPILINEYAKVKKSLSEFFELGEANEVSKVPKDDFED